MPNSINPEDIKLYSGRINSLISGLSPIRPDNLEEVPEDTGDMQVFRLRITHGNEPFLIYIRSAENNPSKLNSADMRLYEELQRLSQTFDIFGMPSKTTGIADASIWENPYLLNLFHADTHVVAAEDMQRVKICDEPVSLRLEISTLPDYPTARVSLSLVVGDLETTPSAFLDDTHVLVGSTIYIVPSVGPNFRHIFQLLAPVDKNLLEIFLTVFLTYVKNIRPVLNGMPARRSDRKEIGIPTLYLEKVGIDGALYMRTGSSLESLGDNLPPEMEPTVTARINGDSISIHEVEQNALENLTDRLATLLQSSAPDRNAKKELYREGNFFIVPEETAGPFLLGNLPEVLKDFRIVGSEKLKEYKIVATYPRLNLKLSSGIDFLEGEGIVSIGNDTFSIAEILRQYASRRYIELSDGNRGILDSEYMNRLKRLFRRRDQNGKIRITIFDLPEIDGMLEKKLSDPFTARSREVLEGFNNLKSAPQPNFKVYANLRPYQLQGVKWLDYLYRNNLGGCLADDMGLGKTLQTIALLTTIYPGAQLPSLIVMPRSLLFNWEMELDRFAPTLIHTTYYGQNRNLEKALEAEVILTTYAVMRNDIEILKEKKFQLVVLDESQNIKNLAAQTSTAVNLLDTDHRLALSGTPMENNLTELYSLFRFLNPPMFGSPEDFNASYALPIQKYGDKEASETLRRKIFPFILRRLKRDVLSDLPERIDQTIYVEMSEKQKSFYEERRISYKRRIDESIARDGVQKSQFLLFQALSELRRIASVPESLSGNTVSSPKIDELLESLESATANGHKSVVFFNFIAGTELVGARLVNMGIKFETMTGSTSTKERQQIVDRFQSDPDCMVLLMTLKVGGVGLNLTAADTVYIFEPWWNKAAEEQAINRLHRIGQKKTVSSFSLVTLGTIEEKMIRLQEQKSELFDALISADTSSSKHLSESDINFILS